MSTLSPAGTSSAARRSQPDNTSVWVTAEFVGFHCWPDAPKEVAFLRDLHRHKFCVCVSVNVAHSDRDVEFFILKRDVQDVIVALSKALADNIQMSCEMMAVFIGETLVGPNFRYNVASVSVSEDSENGATVSFSVPPHNQVEIHDLGIECVRAFHKAYERPINKIPTVHDEAINKLRLRLLREEVTELEEALAHRNPIDVLDALTDIQYILDGTYLSLGFADFKASATAEVHQSNMSKLGADGKPIIREDGKILKGPNYRPPNLRRILMPE